MVNFCSYKNLNELEFQNHLAIAPWHVSEVFHDVDEQAGFISLMLQEIVDEHMPQKKMHVRDGDVPYMTTVRFLASNRSDHASHVVDQVCIDFISQSPIKLHVNESSQRLTSHLPL